MRINFSQTNFEAMSFNIKYRGKTKSSRYRYKQKFQQEQQNPISEVVENNAKCNCNGSGVIIDIWNSPGYDYREDMSLVMHGKEVESPDEFFESLRAYFKSHEFHGLGYDPTMDETYW